MLSASWEVSQHPYNSINIRWVKRACSSPALNKVDPNLKVEGVSIAPKLSCFHGRVSWQFKAVFLGTTDYGTERSHKEHRSHMKITHSSNLLEIRNSLKKQSQTFKWSRVTFLLLESRLKRRWFSNETDSFWLPSRVFSLRVASELPRLPFTHTPRQAALLDTTSSAIGSSLSKGFVSESA